MSKINGFTTSYITIYTLGILTIIASGVMAMPAKVSADIPGYVTPYNVPNPNSPVPNYYYQSASFYPVYTYQSNTSNTSTSSTSTNSTNQSDANSTSSQDNNTENYSSLAANTAFGSNSILPSGIVQWIFFAILVLVIVILTRKIFGADQRYYSTPMKHA
jgi:hypothetical protein